MSVDSLEAGMAHIVRSPGYCPKTRIDSLVVEAEARGIARRCPSAMPALFLKPNIQIYFEMRFDKRLCMVRGTVSRDMKPSETDNGSIRPNHAWLTFHSQSARAVAVDVNPLPARDIWIPIDFDWTFMAGFKDRHGEYKAPTSEMMDHLVGAIDSITDPASLDQLSLEASRLRCLFVDAILKGSSSDMPNIKLPASRTPWTKSAVASCWAKAKAMIDPISSVSDLPSWRGER